MKWKPFLAITLTAAVIFSGCHSPEAQGSTENLQTSSESQGVPEETPAEDMQEEESLDFLRREAGIYEYKGLIFEGEYFTSINPNTNLPVKTFYVDNNSLDKEPGLSLYKAAFDIATLFRCNDVEKIKKYFDNEEDFNFELSTGELNDKIEPLPIPDKPFLMVPMNIIAYKDGFTFIFVTNYSQPDADHFQITMSIFLNEDNEWKVKYISRDG